MNPILELLADNPIIAAVKDDSGLEKALQSECQVIFLLYGTILTIDRAVRRVRDNGKTVFVHIDLIDGLSNREIAVDYLVKLCRPDGIISTRQQQLRRAKSLGLLTVQRAFMLDSMSMGSLKQQLQNSEPDFIEIMPGIIPRILTRITQETDIPVIAGGLIEYKQDVMDAIGAGAIAVSTTCQTVWKM